ncbi:hypothetical protein DV453_000174 [Geotrichum candidum]|nr:hypothetical protein DV453_000174 [Geotrichum candidum]
MYSKSFVTSEPIESIASTRVLDAVKNIRTSLQETKTVEVYELFHALAMDVVTGLILGDDQGTRMLKDQSRSSWNIIDDYRKQSSMWFWTTLMPQFYDWAAGKVRLAAGARAQDWNIKNCESAVEKGPSHGSILKKLYDSGVTGLDAFSEIQDHVAAGHETTGATLSFLTWHLSKHPEVQKKLHEEIVTAFGACPNADYVPPYKQVEKLEYLNGVVMETLRLYAAIPGAEPRVVPPSGMMWRGSDSTNGEPIYIPGGTIISMQPWTLHRDENIYKNALEFDPYRWINASEEELRLMSRSFMAFGAGVRMCLGLHLATEEIKLLVTSMYWRWKTSVNKDYSDDNMYVVDKYTVHPKGHYTLLDFEEW